MNISAHVRFLLRLILFIPAIVLGLAGINACGGGGAPPSSTAVENVQVFACSSQATISWDNVGSGTIYHIYWSDLYDIPADIKSNGARIEDVTSPYVHSNLVNGPTYHYVVVAEFYTVAGEPTGQTSTSSVVSATPLDGGCTLPAPQNVQATAGDRQVTISWDEVDGATSYNLYFTGPFGNNWNYTGPTPSTGNKIAGVTPPFNHTGLDGDYYYYIVTAVNAVGEGSPSSEVNARPIIGFVPVGGTVLGLNGTLILQNNSADDLSLTAATSQDFLFTTDIAVGQPYSVTVLSHPDGQTCQVIDGNGTAYEIASWRVFVYCVDILAGTYTVGGTVSGLTGTGLMLQNYSWDELTINADGTFTFPITIDDGSDYSVTVVSHPAGQMCSVSGGGNGDGSGTISGSNVTNVSITCTTPNAFTVGGTVSGLLGNTLVLQNNGGDDLNIIANGPFTFATPVDDGSGYNIVIKFNPSGQTCYVTNGSGTITGANVTDVVVNCPSYTVGGSVSGLSGTGLVLQNSGDDDLPIAANGPFTFTTLHSDGSPYNVTVSVQPNNQTCAVINGSGTIAGANITNIFVGCAATGFSYVAAGGWHSVSIKTDGTLWAWGNNAYGQLGDGTNLNRYNPTQIGSDNDWAFVAAGFAHTVAVKTGGTLWAWGWNSLGQLGDGTVIDRWEPAQVGVTGWSTAAGDITAGYYHTLALGGDGRLYAWGSNNVGQLGDGTSADRHNPTQIGSDSDWASVAAGDYHSVAQKLGRTLWAWGSNDRGQLGDGTNVIKHSPTQIGSDTDWTLYPAAGQRHTVAVKTSGTLWAWGWNNRGQLGDGTNLDRWVPTQIGTDSNWTAAVGAGGYHTVAVKAGTLWAWGENVWGQLGDGTNVAKNNPTQIGSDTDWIYVTSGENHTLATKGFDTLWAWGHNGSGRLGDGATVNKNIPTEID